MRQEKDRRLRGERKPFHKFSRAGFLATVKIDAVQPLVIIRLSPDGLRKKGSKRFYRLGFTLQNSEHIERDNVARAFPDRIDGGLAKMARHGAGFDIAIAPQALHRLRGKAWQTFADPVFGDGREQPCQRITGVERRGDPNGERGRGLAFYREISEHRRHGRMIGKTAPKTLAVLRVPECLHKRTTHASGRSDDTVEARVLHRLEYRGNAATFLSDARGESPILFDLRRRIGPVAQLVLEPHDPETCVAPAIG